MPTKQLEEAAARAAGQENTDNELLRQALVGCVECLSSPGSRAAMQLLASCNCVR